MEPQEPDVPSKVQVPGPYGAAGRYALVPSIYVALLLILLTIGAVYLLAQLQFLLMILFISALVASGLAGPVDFLERHRVPRAAGILLMFAIAGGAFAGIIWYAVPPLVGQAASFAEDLPDRYVDAQRVRSRILELQAEYPVLEGIDERLSVIGIDAGERITRAVLNLPTIVATSVFALTSIVTLSFLMLMVSDQLKALVLSLVYPQRRELVDHVLSEMGLRLGAYLRAKVIVMTIVGVWIYVTLLLLGSGFALLASIFAAITELLPRVGPWIGRVAIVLAVLPLGWRAVAIAVVSHVVIENLKGSFISPLVEGNQVDIHPLTAFIAVIAGGLLFGWVGALIAVPVTAALQVIVEDVLIPLRRQQVERAEAEIEASVRRRERA